MRLNSYAVIAASFLMLAGCEAQPPSKGNDNSATDTVESASMLIDKIKSETSGSYLSAEQISEYVNGLQRNEFITTLVYEQNTAAIDKEISGKGEIFSILDLQGYLLSYDADRAEMTYRSATLSQDSLLGLSRAATENLVFGEGSIDSDEFGKVNDGQFFMLYNQNIDDRYLKFRALFLRDDSCPVNFKVDAHKAQKLKFQGGIVSIVYRIPNFSATVLNDFNKAASIAWDSNIWDDLILDTKIQSVSIFDREGSRVATVQCD